MRVTHPARTRSAHRVRVGLTLIELIVAALIISLSIIGLISTFAFMVSGTIQTEARAGAYECARLVLERARSNGFILATEFDASTPIASSSPVPNNTQTTWSSPSLLKYRFYSEAQQELSGGGNGDSWPAAPDGAGYAVQTDVVYSDDSTIPSGREDLRLMTISVTVYPVDKSGVRGTTPTAELQTCLSVGGG